MDYGTYRGIFTLILLFLFIAIVFWAYSKRSKKNFEQAANAIFEDEKVHNNTVANKEIKESEK
jgi:cytochrome c oxidase cbb3-type subunit 4